MRYYNDEADDYMRDIIMDAMDDEAWENMRKEKQEENIVSKNYILEKGDSDTKERMYFTGDEIELKGKTYEVITQSDFGQSKSLRDNSSFSDKYFSNINFKEIFPTHASITIKDSYFFNCSFDDIDTDTTNYMTIEKNTIKRSFLNCIFENVNFKKSILENFNFQESVLKNVDFTLADFIEGKCDFRLANFENINFIGVNLIPQLSPKQKTEAYFTEEEKEAYFLRKKKELEEKNKRLEQENQKQEKTIKNQKDKEEMTTKKGIEKLETEFKNEEKKWFIGLCIIGFILLVWLIFMLCNKFSFSFLPFSFFLFSALYFSIFQYSRAKNLRIENQNKLALIHQFNAFELSATDEERKQKIDIVMPVYANIIFTKAIPAKNEKNLPLDEIIRLAEVLRK